MGAGSGGSISRTLTLTKAYKDAYIFAAYSDYRSGTGFTLSASAGTLESVTNGYNGAFGSYLRYVIYRIQNAPSGTTITFSGTNSESYGHGIAIGIAGA